VIFSGSDADAVDRAGDAGAAARGRVQGFRFNSEWLARLVLITGIFGVSTVGNGSVVAAEPHPVRDEPRRTDRGPGLSQNESGRRAPRRARPGLSA
jgi:hypothetical protein